MTGKHAHPFEYDRGSLIEYLWEAHDILGEPPSRSQFDALDSVPSTQPYLTEFGSWNNAKDAAGMEYSEAGWAKRDGENQRQLYVKRLEESSCLNCDEDASPALTFHHTDSSEKVSAVSKMLNSSEYGVGEIKAEMRKCVVLCLNCHSKVHSNDYTIGAEL